MNSSFIKVESSCELEQCNPSDNIVLVSDIEFEYPTTVFERFTGVLDGNGHEISGIYSTGEEKVGGLVNVLDGGTIKNIDIGTTVECQNVGGGVVGESKEGVLQNISCHGVITGKNTVGGLVGINNGIITMSSFEGKIFGEKHVGGISGVNYHKIKECYSEGEITPRQSKLQETGGIAGRVLNGTVRSCLSTVFCPVDIDIGGVAGQIRSATIKQSYNPFYQTYDTSVAFVDHPTLEANTKQNLPVHYQTKLKNKAKMVVVRSISYNL